LRPMRKVEQVQTRYQAIEVWKSKNAVEFRVKEATHAWFHRQRFLTGLAWDMIAAGALLGKTRPPRSILMLGLAGGTSFRVLRQLLPDCRLVAVDIDGEVVELARKHMELDALGVEMVIADAYEWLASNRERFDVVIDDVYLAGKADVFRPKACDGGMLRLLRKAMAPQGILAVNLVTGEGHRRVQSATRRCLREEFPVVRSIRSPEALNEVLVAGHEVAGLRCVADYAESFAHARDRRYWAALTQRRL